jgi:hypothetical protein
LVVNQINKAYNCPQMWACVDEVQKLERHFDGLKLENIPRGKNVIADELSQIAAKWLPIPMGTFVEQFAKPSVTSKAAVQTPTTSSLGAIPATAARQGSALTSTRRDFEPVPIADLAERVVPLGEGDGAVPQVPRAA